MHQLDPEANYMAAFAAKDPTDREAFMERWTKMLQNEQIILCTILVDGEVAGNLGQFDLLGDPAVAYWLGKEYWGQGIATQALGLFLDQITIRPLFARAVQDNIGSIRVLQKNGFQIVGEDRGFAAARGQEVSEYILRLDAKSEAAG